MTRVPIAQVKRVVEPVRGSGFGAGGGGNSAQPRSTGVARSLVLTPASETVTTALPTTSERRIEGVPPSAVAVCATRPTPVMPAAR